MAEFVTVETGTADLDDSIISLFSSEFWFANQEQTSIDQFATRREDINAKSIQITKYDHLAAATTPLTETVDPDSTVMVDSAVTLTPLEYGQVVTTTQLVNLQSGGKADTAAAGVVGVNSALTQNVLATQVMEAGGNVITVDGGAENALTATDIMTATFLNQLYNKLARGNVPKFAGDMYVALLHDDQIHDLRAATAAGSWQDVSKYQSSQDVFSNEVGALGGFRIVRNNNATVNTDAGSGTVDTYHALCLGANALGKATSQNLTMVIKPAGDKLNRFMDIGWKGTFVYGLIDTDNLWVGTSASSVGANT